MKQIKQLLFIILVLVISVSCSVLTDSGNSLQDDAIQIDQDTYTAELDDVLSEFRTKFSFDMIVRLKNTTEDMIFLPYLSEPCEAPLYSVLSMSPSSNQVSALRQAWVGSNSENSCHQEVISLKPGAVRMDTVQINGPFAWESGTNKFIGTLEGGFRLTSSAGNCLEEETNTIDSDCLLADSLVSKHFNVKLDKGPELPKLDLIKTDHTSYIAEQIEAESNADSKYSFKIVAHFENITEETIYLSRCNDLSPANGISYVGPENIDYENTAYGLGPYLEEKCISNPIVMMPGATRVDTLNIQGPAPTAINNNGELTGKLQGEFRLKYIAGLCLENSTKSIGCNLAPEYLPRSNKFRVQLAE